MAVYFVYRCHYGAPSEKHVRRFEFDTVLDWAKAVFRQLPEEGAFEFADKVLVQDQGCVFANPVGFVV